MGVGGFGKRSLRREEKDREWVFLQGAHDLEVYIISRVHTCRVAVGDSAGVVLDCGGPGDCDFSDEITTVTAHFQGFSSEFCGGLTGYEWAVGMVNEGVAREGVVAFTSRGITDNGDGTGHAQLPVAGLRDLTNRKLYVSVRGVTGCGNVLESMSDGFIIDTTPPYLQVIATGYQAIEHAQSADGITEHMHYQSSDLFSSVWAAADPESSIPDDVVVQIGTFPGGSDITPGEGVAGDHIRRQISMAIPEGVPTYVSVTAANGAGLESVAVGEPITMDTTPPPTGQVRGL